MEFIFFTVGGFIGGFIFAAIKDWLHGTVGIIEVDHNTEQCKIRMTSNDLTNRKIKKAIFKVSHDARISREEHGL